MQRETIVSYNSTGEDTAGFSSHEVRVWLGQGGVARLYRYEADSASQVPALSISKQQPGTIQVEKGPMHGAVTPCNAPEHWRLTNQVAEVTDTMPNAEILDGDLEDAMSVALGRNATHNYVLLRPSAETSGLYAGFEGNSATPENVAALVDNADIYKLAAESYGVITPFPPDADDPQAALIRMPVTHAAENWVLDVEHTPPLEA